MQYPFQVGEIRTRMLEIGSGDDAVVCLHGAGSRADRWLPTLPLLAEAGLHAYALDFPGHGLAEKPTDYPYGPAAFTEMVTATVDLLPHPRVTLLGTSLGGHVAAWAACERPDRVRATVLIGAVGLVPWARSVSTSPIIDSSQSGVRSKLKFLVADETLVTDEWVYEESRINSSPGAPEALSSLNRQMTDDNGDRDLVGERYAALGIPTLLCWGANDRWVPPSVGQDAAKIISHAELELIANAGHAPYYERPEAFTRLVVDFMSR